jgi:hypothetical protein
MSEDCQLLTTSFGRYFLRTGLDLLLPGRATNKRAIK